MVAGVALAGNSGINELMRFILGGTSQQVLFFLYPLVTHLFQLTKNCFIVDVNCTVYSAVNIFLEIQEHSTSAYITETQNSVEVYPRKPHLHFHYYFSFYFFQAIYDLRGWPIVLLCCCWFFFHPKE